MKFSSTRLLASLALGLFFIDSVIADPLPDYYSEPGYSAFRGYESQSATETIDPFSGGLGRLYTDLVVPGNGGLDIIVQRYYRAPSRVYNGGVSTYSNDYLQGKSIVGEGWDIHFGHIWNTSTLGQETPQTCGTGHLNSGSNPVLELSDGSRRELLDAPSNSYGYITKDHWIGICETDNSLTIVSPEGMRYNFDQFGIYGVEQAWLVSSIEDRFGNALNIEYYGDSAFGQANIKEVSSSDGRSVTFHYNKSDPTDPEALLKEVKLNTNWRVKYDHSELDGFTGSVQRFYLDDVERRDEGGKWVYEYYDSTRNNFIGAHALEKVTAPTGMKTTYKYKDVLFHPPRITVALDEKSVSGGGVNSGKWEYDYSPSTGSRDYDITTIKSENYCTRYHHIGSYATGKSDDVWRIGTLTEKQLHNNTNCNSLVQKEEYEWDGLKISNQQLLHRRTQVLDADSFKPILKSKKITLDGDVFYTIYSNFDSYGNPRTMIEDSSNTPSRTSTLAYQNFDDTGTWVLGLIDKVNVSGETTKIDNNYYTSGVRRGSLSSTSEYNRTSIQYDYYTSGNNRGALSRFTDEEGNITTYSNYYRGVPERENHPEGVTITRDVNATGTIKWEQDGEGNRTSFTYDNFNRVKTIATPKASDSNVTINWSSGGRVRSVIRGSFVATQTTNGYGSTIETNSEGIRKQYQYNAENYLTFESYPSNSNSFTGMTHTRDVLGRKIRTLNPDGSDIDYDYTISEGAGVAVSNERNKRTVYLYDTYGNPSERYLEKIIAPESVTTTIDRDKFGYIRSITQGGKTRTFNLDSRRFLDSEINLETGTTDISIDDLGNVTSRKVGSSATTSFVYDGLNRLDSINYPNTTPDVDFIYDKRSNLTELNNTHANWSYNYNENNVLDGESIVVQGLSFNFNYDINNLDQLDGITYPNGLTIDYAVDDLGRPTQISGFVSSITYHANGQPNTITYSNGITTTITQDNRLRPDQIKAPSVIDLDYSYDAAGNTTSINDGINSSNNIDNLLYDDIDRLTNTSGPWGSSAISYTIDGNISNIDGGTSLNASSNSLSYSYSSNNRLNSVSGRKSYNFNYDTYGNVINNGTDTFIYNDASQLTDVINRSTVYQYDGNNRRVVKMIDGEVTKIMLYNSAGLLMFETDRFNDAQTAYIYLGGTLIAKQEYCNDFDNDGDGLGSCIEIKFGLNPSITDTDNDGIADGDEDFDQDGIANLYEVNNGLSPELNDAQFDFDNDGLSNFQEFNLGTAANNGDSDSDQLPDGWENANGSNPLLNDANTDADGDGLTNLQEFNIGTRGNLKDSDGDGINDDKEDFDNDGLNNLQEFQNGTLVQNNDTDNDGMPDGFEVVNHLNPLVSDNNLDADNDGLSNIDEMQRGTDPQNADTDSDGVNDGDEVAVGTDPLFNFVAILPAILHILLN